MEEAFTPLYGARKDEDAVQKILIVLTDGRYVQFLVLLRACILKKFFNPGLSRLEKRTGTYSVVFTNFIWNTFRAQDDVATPATMAKDDGVLIYAVGVGPESLRIELQQIASRPLDRHMVRVRTCYFHNC